MKLEGEPPVGRDNEYSLRHPQHLGHKRPLAIPASDVFDHRVAERDPELRVGKRQPATRRLPDKA